MGFQQVSGQGPIASNRMELILKKCRLVRASCPPFTGALLLHCYALCGLGADGRTVLLTELRTELHTDPALTRARQRSVSEIVNR